MVAAGREGTEGRGDADGLARVVGGDRLDAREHARIEVLESGRDAASPLAFVVGSALRHVRRDETRELVERAVHRASIATGQHQALGVVVGTSDDLDRIVEARLGRCGCLLGLGASCGLAVRCSGPAVSPCLPGRPRSGLGGDLVGLRHAGLGRDGRGLGGRGSGLTGAGRGLGLGHLGGLAPVRGGDCGLRGVRGLGRDLGLGGLNGGVLLGFRGVGRAGRGGGGEGHEGQRDERAAQDRESAHGKRPGAGESVRCTDSRPRSCQCHGMARRYQFSAAAGSER